MMHRMRPIALFLTGLDGGGAERVTLTLANALAQAGHQVHLVVCRSGGALLKDVPPTVRLFDLGCSRILTAFVPLVRYLRRERPIAMLSALPPTNCIAVWARAIARVRFRLVLAEHSTISVASKSAYNSKARWILPALMRGSYRHADNIVAVSSGVADDLSATLSLPRERIHVIYNPVVNDKVLARSLEPNDHPWLGAEQCPVILGVGRLTAAKDFATLIRAFAEVRKRRRIKLVILGEGEERPELEALVKRLGLEDEVSLPGFASNPYSYMRRSAAFALSSRWEGLPTVLIEAMACGTSVISTDCPSGPREILEDGKWGQLVGVGNPEGLVAAIEYALDNPNVDVGRRACFFSEGRAVSEYLSVLSFRSEARNVSE